jgi:broad specificity phosphatase PhoE
MIIIIRHSDDESDGCTKNHDCQLAHRGRQLAYKVGRKLIDKYGLPDLIFVSPFRRTVQTMRYMLYKSNHDGTEVIEDRRLSRYFSSKDKRNPVVDQTTIDKDIPIYESYHQFKERVNDFIETLDEIDTKDKVIWVITHVVVYKRLCRNYGINIDYRVPFMENKSFEYCINCDEYHNV